MTVKKVTKVSVREKYMSVKPEMKWLIWLAIVGELKGTFISTILALLVISRMSNCTFSGELRRVETSVTIRKLFLYQ